MCRLILMLEWRRWNGLDEIVDSRYELACANKLAACFHALDMEDEAIVLPCMEILGDVASCLVELFRPAVDQVNLKLNIAPLALPAYRRRALVLTAAELVTQTLLHGFRGRREGQIAISLQHRGHHQAVFLMEDDGCGFAPERGGTALEILAGLTGLLEADVVYRRSKMGGTAAEIRFPVSSSD
jgi:two-component sensor histidine kinase